MAFGEGIVRLSSGQIDCIKKVVAKYSGAGTRVYLFGSRLDDGARGGDVDLLIETALAVPRLQQAQMKSALESELGLPVDILVTVAHSSGSAFETMIKKQAVPLSEST